MTAVVGLSVEGGSAKGSFLLLLVEGRKLGLPAKGTLWFGAAIGSIAVLACERRRVSAVCP